MSQTLTTYTATAKLQGVKIQIIGESYFEPYRLGRNPMHFYTKVKFCDVHGNEIGHAKHYEPQTDEGELKRLIGAIKQDIKKHFAPITA